MARKNIFYNKKIVKKKKSFDFNPYDPLVVSILSVLSLLLLPPILLIFESSMGIIGSIYSIKYYKKKNKIAVISLIICISILILGLYYLFNPSRLLQDDLFGYNWGGNR
jgi:hypothetical protein